MTQSNLIQKSQAAAVANGTKKPQTIRDYINSMSGEIAKALPSVMTPERFTRIALSAVSNNPKLAECTPQSFLGALMNAAQLGLEPNTPLGQAYLIPRRNGKKGGIWECSYQTGYKGLIDLAYRSGEVSIVQAHAVYENDAFEYELGLNPVLIHKPATTNRGKAIAYYAMFKLVNGGYGFSVMSRDDVDEHARRYSQAYSSGPWQTNFDEMALKTVLVKALKYAPLKSDFAKAVVNDTAVLNVDTDTGEILPVDADYEVSEENEPVPVETPTV